MVKKALRLCAVLPSYMFRFVPVALWLDLAEEMTICPPASRGYIINFVRKADMPLGRMVAFGVDTYGRSFVALRLRDSFALPFAQQRPELLDRDGSGTRRREAGADAARRARESMAQGTRQCHYAAHQSSFLCQSNVHE
jgi:hypothetical protein